MLYFPMCKGFLVKDKLWYCVQFSQYINSIRGENYTDEYTLLDAVTYIVLYGHDIDYIIADLIN